MLYFNTNVGATLISVYVLVAILKKELKIEPVSAKSCKFSASPFSKKSIWIKYLGVSICKTTYLHPVSS